MRFAPVPAALALFLTQPGVPIVESSAIHSANCRFERPQAAAALPNDNRTAAGTLTSNVLRLNLSVQTAGWYPEGASGCGLSTAAFAEEGKAPQIPAPLIRVMVGTELQVSVHNALATSIRVMGLNDHDDASADTTLIAAGERGTFRFRVTVPGTYLYRAFVYPTPAAGLPDPNTQLVGAFVVDPAGPVPNDRVLVITRWRKFVPVAQARFGDPEFLPGQRILGAINGLSWPHGAPLQATVGDTVRWRVINGDAIATHPMHLHGFYFRITSYGDMRRDTAYAPGHERMAVTEWMPPNRTMSLDWTPDRTGNWLFHCHMVAHMSPAQKLDQILGNGAPVANGGASGKSQSAADHSAHRGGHSHDMAGLMVGVVVGPRKIEAPRTTSSSDRVRRKLRLLAQTKAKFFGDSSGYGFILQEGTRAPAVDSIRIPGSELALTLGEPVAITVVNRAAKSISMHWHGIELESYFDGVAGWSGDTRRLAPAIAPGDSFVVHITPPRAGTFIYHVHDEQGNELTSGMYGPLVVRERDADRSFERTFVIADAGPGRGGNAATFVNGTLTPDTLSFVAGRTYRLRLIGITANGARRVLFLGKDGPHAWRQVARDGWELGSRGVASREPFRIGPGITVDYEVTPEAGDYELEVGIPGQAGRPGVFTKVPIRVRR